MSCSTTGTLKSFPSSRARLVVGASVTSAATFSTGFSSAARVSSSYSALLPLPLRKIAVFGRRSAGHLKRGDSVILAFSYFEIASAVSFDFVFWYA